MYTEPFHAVPQTATAVPKKTKRVSAQMVEFELDDIESAPAVVEKYQTTPFGDITFGQVTDQIWHFSSVDYGPRCE
jgi:hypothetical protein